MKKNKKILYLFIIIIIIIFITIIYKKMFKNYKIGNNMNSQEIVDYILNINSYKSEIEVQVNSNKNKNKYIIKQEYNKNNGSIQEVIEPSNIAGVKITQKDGNVIVENTNMSLKRIFENYNILEENSLDLICFINDYKKSEKSSYNENNNEIILNTKNYTNKYNENKILYINKETRLPTKLIIEDNNQNVTINIKYNNIQL